MSGLVGSVALSVCVGILKLPVIISVILSDGIDLRRKVRAFDS